MPTYGPWHNWFAWKPVDTTLHGWRWLCVVKRRRCWGEAGFQSFRVWDYEVRDRA